MREPRIAESLLRGFISDPGLEDAILGDLAEERRERVESSGPGPARGWLRTQVLRSVPHLLRHWWLQQGPSRAARTVARVALALLLGMSLATVTFAGLWTGSGGTLGASMAADPPALGTGVLLAGAVWAAAGGFSLAWRAPAAPMCHVTVLGLAWIPAALLPAALVPPPGPPAWLLVVLPPLLSALAVAGGAAATVLRAARRRHPETPGEATPSTPEDTVKRLQTVLRLARRPLAATAVLLLVPLVTMQFTGEVAWSVFDFAFMGALVFGSGFAFELAATRTRKGAYRWAAGVGITAAFLLVWVSAGVGIIGADGDPANLMYGGVLAVGGIGAVIARFRPRGMARVMVAMAIAQAGVAIIAIVAGLGRPYSGAVELTLANGFWITLFALSAWLFRGAAGTRTRAASGTTG